MKLSLRSSKQVWAGLLFMVIGLAVLTVSRGYTLGTARAMGPGYYPMVLAILMTILGFAAVVQDLFRRRSEPVGTMDIVPVSFLVAGVVAFGLLIERGGLVAALLGLIALVSYQRVRTRPLEVLAIFLVVTVLTVGIFIYLIKLPIDVF